MRMASSTPCTDTRPLAVELDGVLVHTDTLHEGLLRLLKLQPYLAPAVLAWSLRGPSFLRAEVARRVELDVALLPYDEVLLSHLSEEKARGRRVVLATSADRKVAEAVAAHLGLFDAVHARGEPFTEPHEEARRTAPSKPLGRTLLKALRVHQWAKNILLFVPLLAAHKALDAPLLVQAVLGFVSFSLCASSVYVLNDLLDLDSDRKHPTKRRRPFASGDLPVSAGLWMAPLLLGSGAAVALLLPRVFLALLATYYAVTLAYSFYLKQVMMMDVLVLAGLYTVRIFGGSLAVGVPTSTGSSPSPCSSSSRSRW